MKLSEDEEAIILGLRHEKEVYNQALVDALVAVQALPSSSLTDENPNYVLDEISKTILALRKL